VGWPQVVSGACLVAALMSLSLYYGFRQMRALRRLRRLDLPREEDHYYRSQARRRLVGSALMFVMAWLLTGVMLYLEEPAQQLADQRDAQEAGADLLTGRTHVIAQVVAAQGLGLPSVGTAGFPQVIVASRVASLDAPAVPLLTPDERFFLRIYGGAWIGILLALLALVLLAAVDVWSTRRYGLRAQRKIQDDRRAMIARQVARLRQERNGHS
jgi:hypothetical protein